MYLRRKADSNLIEWKKNPDKKPLIVKGARQIGKTETIRKFAGENYDSFIEINFVLEPKYKSIINDGYSTKDIIKNISLIDSEKKFVPGKTLIFFDELQEFPEISTALKSFNEDGRFDVICSGSLLGIQYKRIESISVGNKTDYIMYSLDFEEFLWSKGYETATEEILEKMINGETFSDLERNLYLGLFTEYCILGGMPAVVRNYVTKGTFEGSVFTQREILEDYKEDIRKYAESLDQTRILNVFNSIVPQLGKDNKKFQISKVASGARFRDYFGCVEWLIDAGIVNKCTCLNFPELPLKGNTDNDKFKLYFADTGLLIAQLDDEEQDDLRANKNLGTYKGAIYENCVAEAFVKQGLGLFYYKREDSRLEQDFFVRSANELLPVEVKSENNRSKTLATLIKSEKYNDIKHGIKLCRGNIGFENDIFTFPYFCSFLIKRWIKESTLKRTDIWNKKTTIV